MTTIEDINTAASDLQTSLEKSITLANNLRGASVRSLRVSQQLGNLLSLWHDIFEEMSRPLRLIDSSGVSSTDLANIAGRLKTCIADCKSMTSQYESLLNNINNASDAAYRWSASETHFNTLQNTLANHETELWGLLEEIRNIANEHERQVEEHRRAAAQSSSTFENSSTFEDIGAATFTILSAIIGEPSGGRSDFPSRSSSDRNSVPSSSDRNSFPRDDFYSNRPIPFTSSDGSPSSSRGGNFAKRLAIFASSAGSGAVVGLAAGGPVGAVWGGLFGASVGSLANSSAPSRRRQAMMRRRGRR